MCYREESQNVANDMGINIAQEHRPTSYTFLAPSSPRKPQPRSGHTFVEISRERNCRPSGYSLTPSVRSLLLAICSILTYESMPCAKQNCSGLPVLYKSYSQKRRRTLFCSILDVNVNAVIAPSLIPKRYRVYRGQCSPGMVIAWKRCWESDGW
jgi:hypothetical protein